MIGVHFLWLLARAVTRIVAPLAVAFVVALLPLAAYAGTITVNGTTCSLPDAISAANTDAVAGGCTAGSGADTLLLTAATYSLATGPFDYNGMTATPGVTSTIVISGGVGGATVERSGSDHYRLFYVGQTGDLTLQNVVMRYGNPSEARRSGEAIFKRLTYDFVRVVSRAEYSPNTVLVLSSVWRKEASFPSDHFSLPVWGARRAAQRHRIRARGRFCIWLRNTSDLALALLPFMRR